MDLSPGDRVICLLPPAVDKYGRPEARPKIGETYTVKSVYEADYGSGVSLEELSSFPYDGFVLWAVPGNSLNVAAGWYFAKVTKFGEIS